MNLVDTHCHVHSIDKDIQKSETEKRWASVENISPETVLSSARAAGVNQLICVGTDTSDSAKAVAFASKNEGCYSSVGVHPHEAKHYAQAPEKLANLEKMARLAKVVAIGECGLDFHYAHSPKADQIKLLKFQIEVALKNSLPIIFHVREAYEDFWPILDSYQGITGVLHSFSDNLSNLNKALERGLYIGVNGIVTFTKSEEQLQAYRAIPSDKLVLETDSPFLTPMPYRGTINEPKRLTSVLQGVAKLQGQDPEKLAEKTTKNAKILFGLDK